MIEISLGSIGSKAQAERLIEKLTGKTFYNFRVEYGIYAGNYPVSVFTDYPNATKEEVTEMLLFFLATIV